MSELFTPNQSTHSSPWSSPTSQKQQQALDLTPRSKVRALLATLDDESDKENQTVAESASLQSAPEGSHVSHPSQTVVEELHYNANTSGHNEKVKSRRHRLIANLHTTKSNRLDSDVRPTVADNAYDRVKQQLLGTENVKPRNTNSTNSTPDESLTNGHAIRRSSSPAVTPQRAVTRPSSTSPDLFVSPDPDRDQQYALRNLESEESISATISATSVKNRLKALVERKRQERLQKEKTARESDDDQISDENTTKQDGKKLRTVSVAVESDGDESINEEGREFEPHIRPTRKASKKALEDMHRETQRMDRNRQLTHEARTKTKFSIQSLLAKFNYGQPEQHAGPPSNEPIVTSSSVVGRDSDIEVSQDKETPPSSPPSIGSQNRKSPMHVAEMRYVPLPKVNLDLESDSDVPDMKTILSQHAQKSEQLYSQPLVVHPAERAERVSIRKFAKSSKRTSRGNVDSDDDLEIVYAAKPSRLAVFDQLPAAQARDSVPLRTLRALAHLNDNEGVRKRAKLSMTSIERDRLLKAKAKEQARQEREAKIQKLKDKGITVMSAEEKEREQLQIENILERARNDADELAKREKEAAKKEGKDGIADHQLLDSDDSDAEWAGDDDREQENTDLSGSDEEELGVEKSGSSADDEESGEEEEDGGDDLTNDEENTMQGDEDQSKHNPFLANEASETSNEHDVSEDDSKIDPQPTISTLRTRRRKCVLSDDEDGESEDETSGPIDPTPIKTPQTATKAAIQSAFGFPQAPAALPDLPELFAGTMADSTPRSFRFADQQAAALDLADVFAHTMADDTQERPGDTLLMDSQEFSTALLRNLPPATLPEYRESYEDDSQNLLVEDSQGNGDQSLNTQKTGFLRFETQSQLPNGESQPSQMPEPSQDVGFRPPPPIMTLSQAIPASHETVATVLLNVESERSPISQKRPRRLLRAREMIRATASDDESNVAHPTLGSTKHIGNAFDIMRNAATQPAAPEPFDKKRSAAKGMVQEQAEESEDEYAGLGGASDDDSQGELDEETLNMIDDDGTEKVDEADIAAYYADKERADDEKQVERLYRDIANGGLRRKRGADLDLFDSDNEEEIQARRRAAKQRENARMRKALLADEKLGKIAENPKKQAFFETIEDRDDEDDINILDYVDDTPSQNVVSQLPADAQPQIRQSPSATKTPALANTGRKRSHAEYTRDDHSGPRPTGLSTADVRQSAPGLPPNPRRTTTWKSTRPTSLLQVRSVLSELIGDPDPTADLDRDTDADPPREREEHYLSDSSSLSDTTKPAPQASLNPRRTAAPPSRAAVIDRMALKRASSTSTSVSSFISTGNGPVLNPTTSTTASGPTAWHAPTSAFTAFRKPSLLRRATTASSASSATTTANTSGNNTTGEGAGTGKQAVRMGGSGSARSGVNWGAREAERKARMDRFVALERSGSGARRGADEAGEAGVAAAAARRRGLLRLGGAEEFE